MRAASQPYLFVPLTVALSAAAWITLWVWDSGPYARYLHQVNWSETGLAGLCSLAPAGLVVIPALLHSAAWLLMTIAMMLPTVLPLLRIFERLTVALPDRKRLLLFVVLGYLSVWSAFGLLAHAGDAGLHELARRTPWLAWHGWIVGASLLGLAGAYQFSSLKYRCLDKCRSPLMFVTEQWHGGNVRRNSFLLGIRHGLFCVGCCWTLMCLMFAVGTGSVGWMLALGAVMSVEKNLPQGRRLSTPLGAALLGWAALIVVNGVRLA
jgi:predicted metal-binding membrane protein